MTTTTNRLQHETSPYLLQHAHNPVDWHPWGEEALARARAEDRPILLSIGYSACHWCHVMAHESFEDEATAHLMNELFINIKVDREERPDLDRIYQTAHQLLVGRGGGWPLTMFLGPDQVPFFGGTYFPPEPRHGLPAFPDLLQRVSEVYRHKRGLLREQNASVLAALAQTNPAGDSAGRLDDTPLRAAQAQLADSYDRRHHGFGAAPKFPHPGNLDFLLRRDDAAARTMALDTLRAMARGGLQDQIGGGFFRYSVDERWEIPHFEKMLYDNGPLLSLYADAWQISGDDEFRAVAEGIGDWVLREMQQPDGGYYATLDADSEGEEGRFYVWDDAEVLALLTEEEYRVAALHYGLDQPANFEGRRHLHVATPPDAVAAALGIAEPLAHERLGTIRRRLFDARARRTAPGRDDKILAAWNGLMIKGMAGAGRRLGRADFIASAQRAADFIRTRMLHDGRLAASWKDGQARHHAVLDDYAFLLDGLLELLQAVWRDEDMVFARTLAEALLEHFEDESHGGFFYTADDHEQLILRPKPLADEAIPSGNGVAAQALIRLGHLSGRPEYHSAAEATVRAAWAALAEAPYAHASLLLALEDLLRPPAMVVLSGAPAQLHAWQERLGRDYRPRQYIVAVAPEARERPGAAPPHAVTEPPLAFLCHGHQCHPPLHTLDALLHALAAA
ncbi:MAG: thioredoxin domain-containing protein [Gammaproteobacteria bacterium HGW-Gammaproteobacteria-1]|jgi:hypothetical protein|nr:MAG: thioredoxin domain-containing protein [Gammaproteobacteria bacterium HGW-Gammaproteobacteria-1]